MCLVGIQHKQVGWLTGLTIAQLAVVGAEDWGSN